jgi:hypothetical protein
VTDEHGAGFRPLGEHEPRHAAARAGAARRAEADQDTRRTEADQDTRRAEAGQVARRAEADQDARRTETDRAVDGIRAPRPRGPAEASDLGRPEPGEDGSDGIDDADSDAHQWFDDDAGPVVRPYTVSGGRTRHSGQFDMLAFVVATDEAADAADQLQPEHRRILARADQPVSVAELSAHVDLPLGVVRVLVGDLVDAGLVAVQEPVDATNRPEETVLKAVINGLRAL